VVTITGGSKLEERLQEIAKKLSKPATLRVGFLEGATEPDGTSIPMIAAIQEFGAPKAGIPPRPFFRNMIAAKSSEWPEAIGALLEANDYDVEKVLKLVGAGIKGQLQQSIIETNSPALSDVTLMLRKMRSDNPDLVVTGKTVGEAAARVAAGESVGGVSTKPLVDSGNLLNAVDFDVKT
jgi:hypothetical protein